MSAGKIALGLLKWIVVPAAFLGIGYQFIGPTIGSKPPKSIQNLGKQMGVPEKHVEVPGEPTVEEGEPAPHYPEPKVSLRVTKRSGTPSDERRSSTRDESSEEPASAPEGDGVPVDLPTGAESNIP